MSGPEYRVSETWTHHTHAFLYRCADDALVGARESGNPLYGCSMAMVFCAFTLEAYLNYLGEAQVDPKVWAKIERKLGPEDKLVLLCERLGYSLDCGCRPFQTFREIFTFRNLLAHGRPERVGVREVLLQVNESERLPMRTVEPSRWEEAATMENAQRYFCDTSAMIEDIELETGLWNGLGSGPMDTVVTGSPVEIGIRA